MIVYALLIKDADSNDKHVRRSLAAVIGWSVAVVIAMVCGLTWIATAGDWLLPKSFLTAFLQTRVHLLTGGVDCH